MWLSTNLVFNLKHIALNKVLVNFMLSILPQYISDAILLMVADLNVANMPPRYYIKLLISNRQRSRHCQKIQRHICGLVITSET